VDATVLSVAAVQLSSGSNKEANVAAAVELVRSAAQRGATYIQLPEYFNYLGPARGYLDAAETVPGPTTSTMGDLARSLGVSIHLGSLVESSPVSGKVYNTSVLLDPSGRVSATYRKAHLFDVDVPGAVVHRESEVILAGDELALATVEGVKMGLSICFDLRFPEMYRALGAAGALVLCVPAAFNASTGRAHWEVLIRARAIENHAFVVAAAQVGTTAEGIATFGHSMIVDPWGAVIEESTKESPDVLVAKLDVGQVSERRAQIAVMDFRRPDLYGSPVHSFDVVSP